MANYDPIELIKLYLFGTKTPSAEDYNLHIRPWNTNITGTPSQVSIQYDMQDYMFSGAGRYAYPSLFKARVGTISFA
ncbi:MULTISPECIES: hypothetical protein [Methylomonas]|uniref:hypothetical protein n=1 Tax=Methylomonas TaxID=416 RepID=UPI001231EAE1|nr:hypothetical protein [Methylomonas rhizoryzae]